MSKFQPAGPIIKGFAAPWEDYLDHGVRREYRANTVLLHPGEKADNLIYVQKGEVLISRYTMPEEIVRISIIRDKAMLGIINFFTVAPTPTTWLTLRPCVCYLFPHDYVQNECPRHLLTNLLEQLAFMSSTMVRRFGQSSNRRNEVRLARLLLHIADACPARPLPSGRGLSISPSITQEIAGGLIGIHPVTLNKEVAAFRSKGIIGKFTKNNLEILDMERLRAYAEGSCAPARETSGNGAPEATARPAPQRKA